MVHLVASSITESFDINFLHFPDISQTLLSLSLGQNRHVLFIFIFLVVLLVIKTVKYQLMLYNDKIPWFPSLPIIGTLHHVFWNRHDLAKLQEKWVKQYPTIAQTKCFGKKIVFINNPIMLHKLHSSSNHRHLNKPEIIYSKLVPGLTEKGIIMSPAEKWDPHRKLLNKAFNYEMLKSYVAVFKKHSNKLINDLYTPSEISVDHAVYNYCLEIISEIAFGVSIREAITQSEYLSIHECLNRFKQTVTERFDKPMLMLDFLWNLHPKKREQDFYLNKIMSIFHKMMEHRVDSLSKVKENYIENEAKSVLEVLISEKWPQEEILSEVASVMAGGHETIGVTLNFLFFLLAAHKEHQIACQNEVDQLFDRLENSNEELSIQSLNELKYLERCIKETLRMYPAVPIPFREITAPLKIDDEITLDAGTIVGFSLWGLHRNPEYFPNPNKFDPQRFLTENCKTRISNSYIPFSAGVRNCIGWKMAMLEITTITAIILRNFDISTTTKLEDIKIKFSVTIWPQEELNISMKRRCVNESKSSRQESV